MPELPEVETVARGLRERLLGRRLLRVCEHFPGVLLVGDGVERPPRGWAMHAVRRRGKLLVVELEDDHCLSVHLRMTGRLEVVSPHEPLAAHTHVTAPLDDGDELRFVDPRRFGRVELRRRADLEATPFLRGLGPEPFDLDPRGLAERLAGRRGPLKSVLLDQRTVAGLGNIYVDEILFDAGLHPRQEADRLRPAEIEAVVAAMHRILTAAIEGGGSTIRDYRMLDGAAGDFQSSHRVFGREGEPCPRCGTQLRKIRLGGRGTHLCPRCQVKRRRRARTVPRRGDPSVVGTRRASKTPIGEGER